MKEENKELNTIIGKESVVNGKLSIQNSVRIEGKVNGEISSTGTVTIGAKGEVEGDIMSVNTIVGGRVKGSIKATEKIILEANSILVGDLQAARLTIDEGAMFEGKCSMTEEEETEAANEAAKDKTKNVNIKSEEKEEILGKNAK